MKKPGISRPGAALVFVWVWESLVAVHLAALATADHARLGVPVRPAAAWADRFVRKNVALEERIT